MTAVCFLISARGQRTLAQDWLALASLVFYGVWNLQFLPLLLGSIALNYAAARAMLIASERHRSLLLAAAVTFDLGLLGYFKYAGFFVESLGHLTGQGWSIEAVLLPLGISFYTFQQITLLVDVSQGRIERFGFRDFLLFVTFFPHLIAGPIVHHREMMPQFERASYRFDPENLAIGLTLFAGGLFKKTVFADGIGGYVAPLFAQADAGQPMTLVYAWAAAAGFVLQLYFDFSGYSDMALGLARLYGITLPMNFNSPLKARNIVDFWARWHMTLTRFLTACIYNPVAMALARRRAAAGQRGVAGVRTTRGAFVQLIMVPTLVTMVLAGLWHGAGYQFLVFGALHGCFLVVCHAWRLWRPRFWPGQAGYERVMGPLGLVLTLLAWTTALVFFRAGSVPAALDMLAGMAGLHGTILPEAVAAGAPGLAHALAAAGVRFGPLGLPHLVSMGGWIGLLGGVALLAPNLLQVMRTAAPALTLPAPVPVRAWVPRLVWRPTSGWALCTAFAMTMGIMTLGAVTEFLYWQF